ncbi:MAG: hypothetical protein J6T34_03035 [Bacilli bacterium]|nr:hypothetical protein [Bacilli bacterium]
MQTAMVITSIKSAFNALASEDMSPLEKFTTVLMSIGMIVPSTIGIMKGLQTIIQSVSASAAAYTIVMEANAAAERIVQGTAAGYAAVINLKETSLRSATAATLAHIVAEETGLTVEQEATLAKELEALATAKGTALTEADVTACVAHTLAKGAEKKAIMGVVAAKLKAIAVELGFLGTTLLVVAAIAALVAIVWGLVKAF